MKKYHLVIVGFSSLISHKYISCLKEAVEQGYMDSYSVLDIESQKEDVVKRIESLDFKPENIFYLPDRRNVGVWASKDDFAPILEEVINKKGRIKVYIATEVKAHDEYLKYCIENGVESLVEKPVICPMEEGKFKPSNINSTMEYFVKTSKLHTASHSVMTLGRYHQIYNDIFVESLKKKVEQLGSPVTSFHFRTAGGVWNLHREYEDREDHPYKYGYGMLMHGAYHYIDLISQILDLNKIVFPDDKLELTLSSFAAHPKDQNNRIPKSVSEKFDDYVPGWDDSTAYGETDSVTMFSLENKTKNSVITIGTIALEQTTPSIRSWKDLPNDEYNKNGRVSSVDVEAQLSTLYSMNVKCYDVPIKVANKIERIDAVAQIMTRANAALLNEEEYNTERVFNGLFHSDSNRKLLVSWLQGKENKSQISSHVTPMKITQAIAESLQKLGHSVTIDY